MSNGLIESTNTETSLIIRRGCVRALAEVDAVAGYRTAGAGQLRDRWPAQ